MKAAVRKELEGTVGGSTVSGWSEAGGSSHSNRGGYYTIINVLCCLHGYYLIGSCYDYFFVGFLLYTDVKLCSLPVKCITGYVVGYFKWFVLGLFLYIL